MPWAMVATYAAPRISTSFLGVSWIERLYDFVDCSDRVLLAGDDRRYREATQGTVLPSNSFVFALAAVRKNV